MSKILKFNEHNNSLEIAEEFVNMIIHPKLNESSIDDNYINKILKSLSNDLKFNYSLIFTFGTGIKFMYPIVENLIKNGNIKIDLNPENIILLSITALAITYLEENNNKEGSNKINCPDCVGFCSICNGIGCVKCKTDCDTCEGSGQIDSIVSKSDAQTLLEELKLKGIGNGIVKKIVQCFKSITNILKIIFKNSPYVISSLLDMFAYTTLMIPTMNAISSLIGNYKFDMDTLPMNFLSIGIGLTTFLAKKSFNYLSDKLKDILNVNIDKNIQDNDNSAINNIKDGDTTNMGKSQLIKEQ